MQIPRTLRGLGLGLALAAGAARAADPIQVLPVSHTDCRPRIVVPPASSCPTPVYPGLPAPGMAPTPFPSTPGAPTTPGAPETAPTAPTTPFPDATAASVDAPLRGAAADAGFQPYMMGDQLGAGNIFGPRSARFANSPFSDRTRVVLPSTRGFKACENESPAPVDRAYVTFNYYNDVNEALNTRLGNGLSNIAVYRENFGFEKTFLDGDASVGLRLPLHTVTADSAFNADAGRTSTSLGDLSVIFKYAFWRNRDTGSLMSGGLIVTAPTGSNDLADSAAFVTPAHSTILQPFVGYVWRRDRLFVHGFTAMIVPTDSNDVTLLTNDIGVGYYLVRRFEEDRWLTAVVPTFEIHINTPLNHRGSLDFSDVAGTSDNVNLTMGTILGLGRNATLSLAVATPVTGPKPFDLEVVVQFNWRFGARGTGGVARGPGGSVIGY